MKDLTVLQAKRYGTYTCASHDTLLGAAQRMVDEDISCLVVVDSRGYLEGILTRSDLLRAYTSVNEWGDLLVGAYMTREVVTVQPQDFISHVANLLREKQIHRVVIVQKEHGNLRPVGVISDSDMVYHMVRNV